MCPPCTHTTCTDILTTVLTMPNGFGVAGHGHRHGQNSDLVADVVRLALARHEEGKATNQNARFFSNRKS